MTNKNHTVLYVGVTNNLPRRVLQHRQPDPTSFTHRYKITKLVYFEVTTDIKAAILREKQLKAGSRQKKIDLINCMNPKWNDLMEEIV
jgi:putative endonuclease